jgi:DNA-binding response OmpR family regulator
MSHPSKILVVDDEPMIVDILEDELHELGYATIRAGNGQEALDKVATEAPDLVLLDVMMPVMDGLTACTVLKGNADTRLIPVLIMTALDGIEERIKGVEAGADDFLSKPLNRRELIARIQSALRLKHTMDQKLGELRRVRDHFAKFVPEAVRRLVSANPAAPALAKRERDVSLLFLDISGYARLSEQLAPDVLNRLVEGYFSAFLDRIQERDGDINETAGDGFMAIFQTGGAVTHAAKAIETALDVLVADHPLIIHMGINSGLALVGTTRFEGVRGTRWTFTASGAVTNLAARLAGAAGPGEIFVGPDTARRVGGRYRLERVGVEQFKNITEAIEIFRIVRPS